MTVPVPVIERQQSHVLVADVLRRRIALGGFVSGERLPAERELAGTLGVGRLTLHRALQMLAEEGLVFTTRGRSGGTFVTGQSVVPAAQRRRIAATQRARLEQSLEFRLAVEPAAAALCAQRATKRERRLLERLLATEAQSLESYHRLDSEFHLAVAAGSHNELLAEAIERVRADFFLSANALWVNVDWARTRGREELAGRLFRDDHAPIAEAITDGDGDRARARMHEHLVATGEQFEALLDTLARRRVTAATPGSPPGAAASGGRRRGSARR
jgi:GntR family transcriptional regulator, transcriptional repressor for pyruvate dehydrogenase complex